MSSHAAAPARWSEKQRQVLGWWRTPELRREAVRQLRRMASGAPVEELRITQREDGSPELELAGIDPYQLSGVKLGKNGVELSVYSRLEAIDRLLELACTGGDNLLEEMGLSGWNGGKDE